MGRQVLWFFVTHHINYVFSFNSIYLYICVTHFLSQSKLFEVYNKLVYDSLAMRCFTEESPAFIGVE